MATVASGLSTRDDAKSTQKNELESEKKVMKDEGIELAKEAIENGNLEMLRRYLATLGSGDHVDEDGFTLLFFAVAIGNFEALNLLLDMKADYNRRSSNGDTLLHTVITMQNVKMVRMLLDLSLIHI